MATRSFSFAHSCTLPYPLPHSSSVLLNTNAAQTRATVLQNPLATDFSYLRTEPVHFPPTGGATSTFPEIWLPGPGKPANGTRTHFTYVERVSLFCGLLREVVALSGWFAVPEGGMVGFVEVVAEEGGGGRGARVRKVRVLRPGLNVGETMVEEGVVGVVPWWMCWVSERVARPVHKEYVRSYWELFEGEKGVSPS